MNKFNLKEEANRVLNALISKYDTEEKIPCSCHVLNDKLRPAQILEDFPSKVIYRMLIDTCKTYLKKLADPWVLRSNLDTGSPRIILENHGNKIFAIIDGMFIFGDTKLEIISQYNMYQLCKEEFDNFGCKYARYHVDPHNADQLHKFMTKSGNDAWDDIPVLISKGMCIENVECYHYDYNDDFLASVDDFVKNGVWDQWEDGSV